MGGTGVWLKSSIGILVGLVVICTAIVGAITWAYTTFATAEEVAVVEEHVQQSVGHVSSENP
jgi:uncharacterized membrane protein YhiD involved in acid resistance